MTTPRNPPQHLLSFALAALLTLAMLGGIDRLATPEAAPAQMAAQPVQAQAPA
jgi:hypothetical protein